MKKFLIVAVLMSLILLTPVALSACAPSISTYKLDTIEQGDASNGDYALMQALFRDAVINLHPDGTCKYHLSNSAWVETTWSQDGDTITIKDAFKLTVEGKTLVLNSDNMRIILKKS
jgi:hypothetical protein